MPKFRKKPVEVEAMRWDGSEGSQSRIVTWSEGKVSGWFDDAYHLAVDTLEGTMRAGVGDWIIQGVAGEFYPCKPDIFEQTYQVAEEDAARLKTGTELIAAERSRQIEIGYDADHDERHNVDALVRGAGAFLGMCKWPWSMETFHKHDGDGYYVKRNLVKAGAMIAAAIDRMGESEL